MTDPIETTGSGCADLLRRAAVLALLASGCKFVQLGTTAPGHSDGASSSAGSAGSAAAPSAATSSPNHPEQMAKRLATTYASFGGCTTRCSEAMLAAAEIKTSYTRGQMADVFPDMARGSTWRFNPREWMDNPDPTWLPGWDALGTSQADADNVWQAMAVAGNRRAWRAACDAQFDDIWTQHAKREREVAGLLDEATGQDDVHERIRMLLQARKRASAGADKLSFLAFVGAPYEVERRLVEQIRAAKVEFVFGERSLGHPRVKQSLRKGEAAPLRPLYSEADERDLRCGTAEGQPAPVRVPGAEAAKPIVAAARLSELKARAKKDRAAAGTETWVDAPDWAGREYSFVIGKSLKTSTKGGTLTVRYAQTDTVDVKTCRDGRGKVIVVTDRGARVERDQDCHYKSVKRTTTNTLEIPTALVPAGLQLKRGDTLKALARRDGGDPRNTVSKESWSYDVVHIVEIRRGDKPLLVRY